MNKLRHSAALLAVMSVAGALCAASPAHADSILTDSHMLQGAGVISDVGYQFNLSGPGTLDITLVDMTWPTSSLAALSFTANTALGLIGQFNGAGSASYDITGGGTIYAYVTGEATNSADGPNYGVGMYTLKVDFTPSAVPLPGSLLLLLGAGLGLGLLLRRNVKQVFIPNAPPQSV